MILPSLLCTLLLMPPLALGHGIAEIISSASNLSTLNSIISKYPKIFSSFSSTKGTFFAPSNDALDAFISTIGGSTAVTPDLVQGLIAYQLSPGASNVYSRAGKAATLTQHGLRFEGGIVHVVDQVLGFPQPSLKTLLEVIQKLDIDGVVDNTTVSRFTSLAPTDEAFAAAGIDLSALTNGQFVDVLKYHGIVGDLDI